MPERKQFQSELGPSAELRELLAEAVKEDVSDDVLREQRISFAFGNAPESKLITKESVRLASGRIRISKG